MMDRRLDPPDETMEEVPSRRRVVWVHCLGLAPFEREMGMSSKVVAPIIGANRFSLDSVSRGPIASPMRVLLMGVPGVGKTTFAAGAPSPIFLGAEAGTEELDVARFPLVDTWLDVYVAMKALFSESHSYKTLVIDTLDSLEPLCERHVVARDKTQASNVDEIGGGFGKGSRAMAREWKEFTKDLDKVIAAGMNVVLLAHCQVVNFRNPEGPDYDRYSMKMDKLAGPVFSEWVKVHLFAQFEGGVRKKESGASKPKGWSNDARVVYTRRTAAWDAKNRFSLPETLPLSWDDFAAAVKAGQSPAVVRARIAELVPRLSRDDATKVDAALERAGDDAGKLAQLENWALAKVPEENV